MKDRAFEKEFKKQRRDERRFKRAAARKLVAEQRRAFVPNRWSAEPGSELAALRAECHRRFDALWEFEIMTRTEMYRRLARAMGLSTAACHFGMFNEAQCRRALEIRASGVFDSE